MNVSSHPERVLEAILAGADRPTVIGRRTCLGQQQVTEALRELRKKKLVVFEEGRYRKADSVVSD